MSTSNSGSDHESGEELRTPSKSRSISRSPTHATSPTSNPPSVGSEESRSRHRTNSGFSIGSNISQKDHSHSPDSILADASLSGNEHSPIPSNPSPNSCSQSPLESRGLFKVDNEESLLGIESNNSFSKHKKHKRRKLKEHGTEDYKKSSEATENLVYGTTAKSHDINSSNAPRSSRSRSRSRSPSEARSHSKSMSKSPSKSKSRSVSRSKSRSLSGSRSRSRSRSRSKSVNRSRSRSGSVNRSRSRSGSVNRSRSRSGSVNRSRSGSKSRSKSRSRSRSNSVARSISRSKSRSVSKSKSKSPLSGSGDNKKDKTESVLKDLGSDSDSEVEAMVRDPHINTNKLKENGDGDKESNMEVTQDNLFGDAGDISSDEEEGIRHVPVSGQLEAEDEAPPEDEDQLQEIPETRIDVEIPRINTKLGNQLFFVKLPNFLSVDTRPYDPQTYEDEIDEDEVLDEEGRARLKLKVENTIRWRVKRDDEGNEIIDENNVTVKESNARVVTWSDGSMSLHLGEEIFDIHTMPLTADFNHLFVRQGTGLQGQAVFRAKLTFRPSSTESMTHRKMTMSLADRSLKTQKVKVLPIAGSNPDAHRTEMIKKEEEKLRASMKRESHQRRLKDRQQARNISSAYLEGGYDDDDDNEDISITAIKNRFKKGVRPDIYSSDSEVASESDDEQTKKLERAKIITSDEEHSDNESAPAKKKAKVIESEDEDE